jgi:RsiG-like
VPFFEDVSDPSYLDGLGDWPIAKIRTRRDEANEVETGLSYQRRIVQGRLDIVAAELHRRQAGDTAGDVSELIEQLPSILSEHVRAPGLGRLPALMGPGQLDPGIESKLEEILPATRLSALPDLEDSELSDRAERLDELERSVSAQRKAVFEIVDRLQAEVVRRYRSGEATVDSLLS